MYLLSFFLSFLNLIFSSGAKKYSQSLRTNFVLEFSVFLKVFRRAACVNVCHIPCISIMFRLCDLYKTVEDSKTGVKFTDNVVKATRSGKKGDVYQLVSYIVTEI